MSTNAASADAALIDGHYPLEVSTSMTFCAASADAALIDGHQALIDEVAKDAAPLRPTRP